MRVKISDLLERIIFFSALALVALCAIPYGSVEIWWTALFEIGVLGLTVLWAVQAVLDGGFGSNRWAWLCLPSFALIILCLIQIVPFSHLSTPALPNSVPVTISADPFETRSFILRLAAATLLGVLLLRFTRTRARLRALVVVVIAIAAASAIFGILRQVSQHDGSGFFLPALQPGIGYAQIISRNQFAFMMEMALGLALGMIWHRGARLHSSLWYVTLAVPIAAALVLANSRGGVFTMICQLILFAGFVLPGGFARRQIPERDQKPRGRLFIRLATKVVIMVVLLMFTSVAVVWVGGERVVSNLSTVSSELQPAADQDRSNTRRVDIWRATWNLIKAHPVTGAGFGAYWIAIPQYHDASGAYTPQQAHNDYLELLASGGIFGLAIFTWFLFVLFRRWRQVLAFADPFRRAACVGALLGMFGVAVHSLFDFGLHLTINSAICVMLIVISTTEVDNDQREGSRSALKRTHPQVATISI
jgi:O-antigen ligase